MSDTAALTPTGEQRRVAAQQFERARQVLTSGDYDYAIDLLLTCCRLDAANLIYRQTLRHTEKTKYKNNLHGSFFAFATTAGARTRLRVAQQAKQHLKVLEHAEQVLTRNPWNTNAQLAMAEAAGQLGLVEVAIWTLEQARQKNPKDLRVNRALARQYEKQGDFQRAIALWDMIRDARPLDEEASRKGKDLAASETIVRGQYVEVTNAKTSSSSIRQKQQATLGHAKTNTVADRLARQVEPLRAKITAEPTHPNAYLQLAKVYQYVGQPEQARHVLEEGLGPTGQNFELAIELAELEIEPFRANLRVAEQQHQADPENEELAAVRQNLWKEINTREMEVYRRRVDRFPTDGSSRVELGIRLLRAGQGDEAIQELQHARKDPRQRWRALFSLGQCFKAKKNWPLAKRNFEEALQLAPPDQEDSKKELLFQLAKGAADHQEWETALHMGNELAHLDFNYRDIGRLLDEWHSRSK